MSAPGAPFAASATGDAVLRIRARPAHVTLFDLQVSASRLVRDCAQMAPGFGLVHVAAGRGLLQTGGSELRLSAGDVAYGRLGRCVILSEATGLRLRGALFPRDGSGARLASLPACPAILPQAGGAAFLGSLIGTAVERLEALTPDDIRPLEIALLEFLTATLSAQDAAQRVLQGSSAKNALALRAMQTVEVMLSQPDLSPAKVAQRVGISLRYLQLLFEAMGENPNHYIRRRRLERCAADLADPRQAGQSIGAICYRWGFADPAYFSRIFREVHGLSPSEHRARARRQERQAA